MEAITHVKMHDVSVAQAKKEIVNFLKQRGEALPSEISSELKIDLDLVFSVLKKLKEEGAGEWL